MLPRTSGAAIERADRISAAFQGAIAPTTPTGRLMPIANAPGVRRDHLSERRVRERRGLPEETRDEMHLEHAEAERAAGLPREHRHDLVLARLEHVGRLQEDALPHGRRRARPLGEGLGGRLDRPLRVRPARARDVGDDVAAPRVAVLERAAALGLDERAPDEEPRCRCRSRSGCSSLVSFHAPRSTRPSCAGRCRPTQCSIRQDTSLVSGTCEREPVASKRSPRRCAPAGSSTAFGRCRLGSVARRAGARSSLPARSRHRGGTPT